MYDSPSTLRVTVIVTSSPADRWLMPSGHAIYMRPSLTSSMVPETTITTIFVYEKSLCVSNPQIKELPTARLDY